MKKRIWTYITVFTLLSGIFSAPVLSYGAEAAGKDAMEEPTGKDAIEETTGEDIIEETTEKESSDLIAGEDEKAPAQKVGTEGMVPVYGKDVADGTYDIEVESSSSMFRITKAELTVSDGNMSAVITLGGKGYTKLFMGIGEEAVAADESAYAGYTEDAEGAYTYEIAVEALNQELECTGFSKRKEKWYDHQICFDASSLPKEALLIELPTESGSEGAENPEAAVNGTEAKNPEEAAETQLIEQSEIDLEDGVYRIEADLAGGSGRASIESPAIMKVADKKATAVIVWSSSNYDYMIVNGETYLPVNTEGNSTFEIPVLLFEEEMPVTADTVAMGTPHEVAYTLTFHRDSIEAEKSVSAAVVTGVVIAVVLIAAAILVVLRKRKKNREKIQRKK